MIEYFKRKLIRRKLKSEKRKLLLQILEINRKLKILDDIDEKEKEERKKDN